MAGDSGVKLKLTVWRDFVPNRSLVLRGGTDNDHRVLAAGSDLQQEVYSWQMREDPFAGVPDEGTRKRLQELLIDRFEASSVPAKRGFVALGDFLKEVTRVIESGQSEWIISQDAPADDESTPYRLNTLLALKLHLEWLSESFAERPGISVSIR